MDEGKFFRVCIPLTKALLKTFQLLQCIAKQDNFLPTN